jgi:hypothetical protein
MSAGGEHWGRTEGWYIIQHSVPVARPFEDVASLLVTDRARIFGGRPTVDGRGLEFGVGRSGVDLPRTVMAHLGGVVHLGDRILLPVSWADFGARRLYTVLKAIIEVVPGDDAELTQVGLVGRCRPPVGRHREEIGRPSRPDIVAAAVENFVADLAARLETELTPSPR